MSVTDPESFTLDGASNLASRTGPAATYSYDTADRLTADGTQAFTWSDADRLTNRGADTFSYDSLDRLTASTVAGAVRGYAYSGDGLLQSRTQGTATMTFLWDPATSPSRLLMQGSDKLVYGLGPLYAARADGTTLTLARDGGKSVRAELDGTGAVTATFRYRAYGDVARSTGAAAPSYLGYAGRLVDPSGLLYMRARWYDPATGRFMSRDPLAGDPSAPRSLNAFGYAGANPALLLDPSGLAAAVDTGGACDESCRAEPPIEDVIKASLDAGLEAGGVYLGSQIPVQTQATLSIGVVSGPGYSYARIDYRVAETSPIAKNLLEGAARGAAAAGVAQLAADYLFHPELSASQRAGRFAVATGVGLLAAVATPVLLAGAGVTTVGVTGFVVGTGVAIGIGIGVDALVTRRIIYPTFRLGR